MTDIPIKLRYKETFTDSRPEDSHSQSPPPVQIISDEAVSKFLQEYDHHSADVSTIQPLTALSVLNYLLSHLLRSSTTPPLMTPSDSTDTVCTDDSSMIDEDDSPLSPKKRRWSNDTSGTQILETDQNVTVPMLHPDGSSESQTKSSSPSRKSAQDSHLAKRFSLTRDPGLSITEYLERIHRYCQLSTAVYLCASLYIYKLVVEWESVHLTKLNVHRLIITALRLACKTLEDITHRQQFIAKMGGINTKDLHSLEISFLFLLKFNCQADAEKLSTVVAKIKDMYLEANSTITN